MATIHYPLFDTAQFGTTGGAEFTLFQVAQGTTTQATESFTNMRGTGVLPNPESFTVKKIRVFPDYAVPRADVTAIWRGSYMQLRINDQIRLHIPLALAASNTAYSGADTTTAGANQNAVGLIGDGFMLEQPLDIPGGTVFRVRVVQGAALATANGFIKVVLDGLLTTP